MSKPGVSNLNFYLIAIGISAQDKDAMRQLCRPQHAHLIECGDDYNIFRKTYSEVSNVLSVPALLVWLG